MSADRPSAPGSMPAPTPTAAGESTVRVAVVHPDLLGTYGDGGNAVVLAQRLRWRGIPAEVLEVRAGEPVPASCDLYCLGGGEDAPQSLSAAELRDGRALERAVEGGAVVLAVCAGFQNVGREFAGADGKPRAGLGLLDVRTRKGDGPRAVGEVVAEPIAELALPLLTGYENHGGITVLGAEVKPFGRVRSGIGNGAGDGTEGAIAGKVVGTYLHGPVLARNPALADLLLSWAVGPLAPIDDDEIETLRRERLERATDGRWRRLWARRRLQPA